MYKTYVCSSLFWEVPHHLIVNVYYIPSPPPPRFNVGRGQTRRPESKPTLNGRGGGGGGVKLEQSKWLISNKKNRIRYKLFAGNISMLPIFPSSKLMVFVWPKNTIFSTNYLKQSSCIILLQCTYWCKYFMFVSLHLHKQIFSQCTLFSSLCKLIFTTISWT